MKLVKGIEKEGEKVTYELPNGGIIEQEYHAPHTPALADVQNEATNNIDQHAAFTRLRFITNTSLQIEIYNMKAAEATSYVAAGYPTATTDYPMIAAEAAATSQTPKQVADIIVATKASWMGLLGKIEGIRISAKDSVVAATNATEVETITTTAISDLDAL